MNGLIDAGFLPSFAGVNYNFLIRGFSSAVPALLSQKAISHHDLTVIMYLLPATAHETSVIMDLLLRVILFLIADH